MTGDSFKLARDAAARPDAEFIVFCGVHFMAESADILTSPEQKVILPDLAAGCSMADMARLAQVEDAWDVLADAGVADVTVPVTYMNSSADIKAFCGKHDGVVCTSSNAKSGRPSTSSGRSASARAASSRASSWHRRCSSSGRHPAGRSIGRRSTATTSAARGHTREGA